MIPLLTSEELQAFLNPFRKIPLMSGIQTTREVGLQLDIAVGLFADEYYEVRFFPAFTDASAVELKEEFAAQVAEMVAAGRMDEVAAMPISLEQMQAKNAREFNAFPIYRIESMTDVLKESEGYTLQAVRFMPDPALGVPCIMLSYAKEGARNIDVFLLTVSLTPKYNAILDHMQQTSAHQAAAARVEAVDTCIETAGPVAAPNQGERLSEGGIILN